MPRVRKVNNSVAKAYAERASRNLKGAARAKRQGNKPVAKIYRDAANLNLHHSRHARGR